jgi:hypothetical protein
MAPQAPASAHRGGFLNSEIALSLTGRDVFFRVQSGSEW